MAIRLFSILCAYIETRNPDVTTEAETAAVYYGMSVDPKNFMLLSDHSSS